jgi:hypothetical protein
MRISASFDPSYCYAWKPQQCTRAASEADFLIPSGHIATLRFIFAFSGLNEWYGDISLIDHILRIPDHAFNGQEPDDLHLEWMG